MKDSVKGPGGEEFEDCIVYSARAADTIMLDNHFAVS